jgi:hypothetical protein
MERFLLLETHNMKTCCNWMVLFEESIKMVQKRIWKYDYSFLKYPYLYLKL